MSVWNQNDFDRKFGKKFDETSFFSKIRPTFSPSDFVPLLSNIRSYRKKFIIGDIIAGFTVACFNIPQGMAYASLAELPPVIGLYMGFLSPLFYCVFGTSRHISVATFAPVSMMSGFAIDNIAMATDRISFASNDNSTNTQISDETVLSVKLQLASILSFFAGVFLLLFGICRLGFVGSWFSSTLVQGFTFGVAFHVATSQIIKIFGLKLEKYVDIGSLLFTWRDILLHMRETNICSLTVGLTTGFVLYILVVINEHFKSRLKIPIPAELICVAISIIISHFCKLSEKFKVGVVGHVPTGFPEPSVSFFHAPALDQNSSMILSNAVTIGLVSFAVSLALAKLLAERHGYTVRNNQELVALGFVNIGTSFFGCFPSAASPSRSQLQSQVGGNSQFASVIASVMLLCVLLFAGPLFTSLPFSVLGAIVIVALRSFFKQALLLPKLYKADKWDFGVWVVTAGVTLLMNITWGLLLGIGFSLFTVLWRSQNPECVEIGLIKGTHEFRDVRRFTEIQQVPQVLIFRFNMSLFFANAEKFLKCSKSFISLRLAQCKERNEDLKWMIVDGNPFNFMDHSGINVLRNLHEHCKNMDIKLIITNCRFDILMKFRQEGLTDVLDADSFFPSTHDAIRFIDELRAKDDPARESNSGILSELSPDSDNGRDGVEHSARVSSGGSSVEMTEQERDVVSSLPSSESPQKNDQDSYV